MSEAVLLDAVAVSFSAETSAGAGGVIDEEHGITGDAFPGWHGGTLPSNWIGVRREAAVRGGFWLSQDQRGVRPELLIVGVDRPPIVRDAARALTVSRL